MYQAKVLDAGKKSVVTREEMEQLVSTAERLSDELARANASKNTSLSTLMLYSGSSVIIGFAIIAMLLNSSYLQSTSPILKIVAGVFTVGMISYSVTALILRHRKWLFLLNNRTANLKSSLDSIMNLLEEARLYYEQDLSPIEAATLKIRLQTIGFS